MSARSELARLMDGFVTTQLLYAAAKLGVADVLAAGPETATEIAQAVGVDADRLERVLRGLVIDGVLAEDGEGRFSLSPIGECLREDVPGSMRGPAVLRGELYYGAAAGLVDALLEGTTAFDDVYGEPFFEHLGGHPEHEAVFQTAMAGRAEQEAEDIVAAYDFGGLGLLVDAGGGSGALLAAILTATPGLRGVLVDRPAAVARARERMAAAGLEDRVECVAGDFFAEVPTGGDAYLLSRVLHDWSDDDARRILRACRAAMTAESRLLVIDAILPRGPGGGPGAIRTDLHNLLLMGARERTEQEFRELLGSAAFDVLRVVATNTPAALGVIEARPKTEPVSG